MTPLDQLDLSANDVIATLCGRALARPPSAEELAACLFDPVQPAVVRGDPSIGVVATVRGLAGSGDPSQGYVRLLVVDPDHRRSGNGTALLSAAEQDLATAGVKSIAVGADPPYYLFPGVETTQLPMLCLLERHRYVRQESNFNMDVELDDLPPDPIGPSIATTAMRDEVRAFVEAHYVFWTPEVLRALDKGSLVIERDQKGLSAFCAYNVNRVGLLGPVAVRPELMGQGAGVGVLVHALHRMREEGARRIEVSWVGPIVPYARVRGTLGRVFFVYRKQVSA